MIRLTLNLSSTRLILTNGHSGTHAAGQIIEAFGHLLMGGNFLIGVVIFIILSIVSLVVIPRAPAASPRSRRGLVWTPCPASRWRSTPTSPPA